MSLFCHILFAFILSVNNIEALSIDCYNSIGNTSNSSESTANCPSPYSITSCNSIINGTFTNSGTFIENKQCRAFAAIESSTGSVTAIARCCNLTDYNHSFRYYFSEESTNGGDDLQIQTCNSTTDELIGCVGYSPSKGLFEGTWSGSYHLEWEDPLQPTLNRCTAHNGLGGGRGVFTGAICYDKSTITDAYAYNLQCFSLWHHWHDQYGNRFEVSCPNDENTWFMTSCMGNNFNGDIKSTWIDDNTCIIDAVGTQVNLNGICCMVSATVAPTAETREPTPIPTDIPYSPPHISIDDTHFYVSTTRLDLDDSIAYCEDVCHSQLASIHSVTELEHLQYLALYSPQFEDESLNGKNLNSIRIGLIRDFNSTIFQWIDESVYDYGTNNTIYPWKDTISIDHGMENCVVMRKDVDYEWDAGNTYCSNEYRFACNSCDGELHKYAARNKKRTWSSQRDYCMDTFGTYLASIHSRYDYVLIKKLAIIVAHYLYDFWIGLRNTFVDGLDVITFKFSWDDGTSIDYWNDTWDANIIKPMTGEDHCVQLETKWKYRLKDDTCDEPSWAICALPSLLCYHDYWNEIEGEYSWNINCELYNDNMNDNHIVISNREWINYNGKFVAEYIYKFNSYQNHSSASAGIMIIYDEYHWYDIALSPVTNQVILSSGTLANHTTKSSKVSFNISIGMYYVLKVQALNNTNLVISVNDKEYIRYESYDVLNTTQNPILSGFLGIKSSYCSIHAKSLYASGASFLMNNSNIIEYWNLTTKHPSTTDRSTTLISDTGTRLINISTSSPGSHPTDAEDTGDSIGKIIGVAVVAFCCLLIAFCVVHRIKASKVKQVKDEANLKQMVLQSVPVDDPMASTNEITTKSDGAVIEMDTKTDKYESKDDMRMHRVASLSVEVEGDEQKEDEDDEDTDSDGMYSNVIQTNTIQATHGPTRGERLSQHEMDSDEVCSEGKKDNEIREWLSAFGLENYVANFIGNGFDSLEFVKAIRNEKDLQNIGIVLKGHQLKILQEISKLNASHNTNNDDTAAGNV